jgi:outer membrane receptor protein involved in Fe transport
MLDVLLLAASLASSDTTIVPLPEIVVSATRVAKRSEEIPNATVVIRGEDLRRRGVHTFAEAIEDVVGVDSGEGSDNGSRLPNVGMWGLKEFDALLITYDGVPVGGPFSPSLAQIPVEDLDRIEIVKGPQGTLYGVSAFAGMIQAFSRSGEEDRGHLTAGGGSFGSGNGSFGWGREVGHGTDLRLTGIYRHSDGWQDRTQSEIGRAGLSLGHALGKARLTLDLSALRDRQDWGTPLPFDGDAPAPELSRDRSYAVGDAVQQHEVFGVNTRLSYPLSSAHRLENTLAFTRDDQRSIQSFPGEIAGDTLVSEGVKLEPREATLYEDLRLLSRLHAGGEHEAVLGAALTWGRTTAEGIGFDFDQLLSEYPNIPSSNQIPVGDHRAFADRRTFFGLYAHDSWTPVWRVTLAGGARWDATSEKLHAQGQEVGDSLVSTDDERSDGAGSGDVSVLVRTIRESAGALQAANLYASWRTSFKPAAPNLTEAEDAEILEPERTRSWEAGAKIRALDRLAFNLSFFDMTFDNMVVAVVGTGGEPALTNAGKQRFKGEEADLRWSFAPGVALGLGYAHHDARFVHFTTVDEDGFLDASGNMLELVPRHLFNIRLDYASAKGPGAFAAARYQGKRPLDRDNLDFLEASTEWDAGVSYRRSPWMVTIVGRNLGDDRHVVTESEIGDSEFYIAAPRRFEVEATIRF